MANIKGQNLRLFFGGKAIAAATSCNVELTADVSDCSTKDSTGGWAENVCTGKSWKASADMMVLTVDGYIREYLDLSNPLHYNSKTSANYFYAMPTAVNLKKGDVITACAGYYTSIATGDLKKMILTEIACTKGTPGQNLEYEATEDMTVYIIGCYPSEPTEAYYAHYTLNDDANFVSDFVQWLQDETDLTATLEVTEGTKNRKQTYKGTVLSGTCNVTSISVTAQNRNFITATVELTGTGEPTITDLW